MAEQPEPLPWGRIFVSAAAAVGGAIVVMIVAVVINAFRLGAASKGVPDLYDIDKFADRIGPIVVPIALAIGVVVMVQWAARNTGRRGALTGGAIAVLSCLPGFVMIGDPGQTKMFIYFGLILVGYFTGEIAGRLPPAPDKSKQWAHMLGKIEIVRGDITRQRVDVIVNPANPSLLGGSGVDGAIHRAAGPELLAECRKLNGCQIGEAKVTKGYKLHAPWVIHIVAPTWRGGDTGEENLLASCYRQALELAVERNAKEIAFSSSTGGTYSYPIDRAGPTALRAIATALTDMENLENVVIVCTDHASFSAYQVAYRGLKRYLPSVKLVPKRLPNAA